MTLKINGIQQLGVGVENLDEAWKWYRQYFSMDISMFEDESVAELMLPHTAGKPRPRKAVLALNMRGGGGFEIWQHLEKTPEQAGFEILAGDLGINCGKLKTDNVKEAYETFRKAELNLLTEITENPSGNDHFFMKDPFGNMWEIVYDSEVFRKENSVTGGVLGIVAGVKDIEESLKVYRDILGYNKVVYDKTGTFDDLNDIPGGNHKFRRVLLEHSDEKKGAFSPILGNSVVELLQVTDREPRSIYNKRIWGDPGFIHICYDINGMDELREKVKKIGYPFTVDSAHRLDSFDMGEAAGNFAYIQAPEGTLIEFVETHKIPLMEKIGWYLDFRKRGSHPLPNWMLKLFRFKRVKD